MPFVRELLQYTNDVFIETGTYKGDTLEFVRQSNKFKILKSMELSEPYHRRCSERFVKYENVTVHHGNSRYDLVNIIRDIHTEITFWLDSHWSGGAENFEIGCDPELKCPVLHELDQIKNHPIKTHTIMVDDIRLMDGSHFEVTLDQINKKILEINPNYKIVFYNDECAEKDVLVAYIPKCIHTYLTVCNTNSQPPGIADFIRGTICLFQECKKFNYKLLLNNSHPIFKYLSSHPRVTSEKHSYVHELIPGSSFHLYNDIYRSLVQVFEKGESFSCISNSFYTRVNDEMCHWGHINNDCKHFLKELFTPTDEMRQYIQRLFDILHIDCMRSYRVIHLRFGDDYIHQGTFNENRLAIFCEKIQNLISEGSQYILLTDSVVMGSLLKEKNPGLFYYDNKKIHLGDLKSPSHIADFNQLDGVRDTMADFFILSKAEKIYSNGSGFSLVHSLIYDIEYNAI
jgi:hypothetical protein